MRVCIDPGHSGPYEPGACAGGRTEADLALKIARHLGDYLARHGHAVFFTRQGDIETDSLGFRAELANRAGADVFVSVHLNGAICADARGVETYHHPGSAAGKCLAAHVQGRLAALGYTPDRGVREADFAVLRLTNMPAILVEAGFITSDADRSFLARHPGQLLVGHAIGRGILEAYRKRYLQAD